MENTILHYLQQFLFLVPSYLTNEITFIYCIFIVVYVKYWHLFYLRIDLTDEGQKLYI